MNARGERRSTCDGMGKHRGAAAPMRDTVQLYIIVCGVQQLRHCHVAPRAGHLELQRIKQLQGVTDADHKDIEVARDSAPGQGEVIWAHRRSG